MTKLSSKEDLDAYLAKNKSVLTIFYSTWCPYCVRFVPFFEKKVNTSKFNVLHVLIEDDNNPLWDEYNIPAVPTVILFEDGKVKNRIDARLGRGLKEDQFSAWFEELYKS
jgi:thioredoxin 1